MREKLNENPLTQLILIGVLLLGVGFFVMSMGGGEKKSEAPVATGTTTESATEVPASLDAALAKVSQATAGSAKPLPRQVDEAWHSGETVVLLFVRNGGIDDARVAAATRRLAVLPGVAAFIAPASEISRYAAITEGVRVNRVPALVVVRPKRLHQTLPTASVSYGFQSGQSVVQAVVDAGYKGPTLSYHP
ncbi:MAG TPA: hypothetical protein VID51_03520 [Solirubrobacterales bacterium]|jgi:hypothetical protein